METVTILAGVIVLQAVVTGYAVRQLLLANRLALDFAEKQTILQRANSTGEAVAAHRHITPSRELEAEAAKEIAERRQKLGALDPLWQRRPRNQGGPVTP